MTPKEEAFASLAEGMIKKLEMRGMEGHYFENREALCSYLKEDRKSVV